MTDQQPPTPEGTPATPQDAPAAQPAYETAPPAPVGPPAAPKTNTLAIVAFIASFFVSLAGIICGHIALSQIKKRGEGGRGFAIAGLIIGYFSFVVGIITLIVVFAVVLPQATTIATKATDCVKVETAGNTMIQSLNSAFGEAQSSLETAQTDLKAATDEFQKSTAGVKDPEVAADVKTIDAKLDALNTEFGKIVSSGDTSDTSAFQTATNDVESAFTALDKTCKKFSK